MGWLEEQFGGDIAKAGDLIAGSQGIGGAVEVTTLGLVTADDVKNIFKGPDMSEMVKAQEAQMQAELLRRSRLENLKDMQSSQIAAQSRQRSTSLSQTDLNASSALNFIGL